MIHVESLPSRQLNRGWGSAVEPATQESEVQLCRAKKQMEGPLTPEQTASFAKDGPLIVQNLLSPEELSHLVQPIEGTSPDAQSPVNMLFDTNQDNEELKRLANVSKLIHHSCSGC